MTPPGREAATIASPNATERRPACVAPTPHQERPAIIAPSRTPQPLMEIGAMERRVATGRVATMAPTGNENSMAHINAAIARRVRTCEAEARTRASRPLRETRTRRHVL